MKPTTLLTGASGFLGQHVRRSLLGSGWSVLCCSRQQRWEADECEVVRCDLNEPAQILALEKLYRPRAIVHLACDVGLDATDQQIFIPNVLATGCIAYLARVWDARLVFASSVMVHGARTERVARDTGVHPDTAYGRSKAAGEELIRLSGAQHCILRIAGIFGARGPRHLGLNRAIDAAVFDRKAPTQVGAGEALRNYIYVKDAAAAIAAVLRQDICGTHPLAGSEVLSVARMLHEVCEVLLPGTSPSIEAADLRARDQVVAVTPVLPATRSFRDALLDIRESVRTCA